MSIELDRNDSAVFNDILYYDGKRIKVSPFFYQKNFDIKLREITIIGLKKGVFFDDDYTVIVLISKSLEEYFLPTPYFTETDKQKINDYFEINLKEQLDLFANISEYPYNAIIYPKKLGGKRLFKQLSLLEKIKIFFNKMTFRKKYPSGIISNIALDYIKSSKEED